jgi:hypothetical protein
VKQVLCFFGKHSYAFLGNDRNDEVYRCVRCGERMVKPYSLRIDRLGGKTCEAPGPTPSVRTRASGSAAKPRN